MDETQPLMQLNPLEARILGALIEKAVTTPDYYPLTVNALLAACNQKNNRNPVMSLDEPTLSTGLYSLQEKRLLEFYSGATARVLKYRERLTDELGLAPDERAVICELLLRGPQTPGELRNRAARLHPFGTLEEVQATLARLAARESGALVTELPRLPGQKENRFTHLLSDLPAEPEAGSAECPPPAALAAVIEDASRTAALEERLAQTEEQMAALREQLSTLQQQFDAFRAQFE